MAMLAFVASGLVFVGWRSLSLGLADHFARTEPERALSFRPDHPLALVVLAERRADAGDWVSATGLARRALTANPLQARAYGLLARAAETEGDIERARDLYLVVARRLPRDLPSRIWLFNYHLQADQPRRAMADLDAMLRAKPQLLPVLLETVYGVATRPELQPSFVATLQTDPPWRSEVLRVVVQQAPDLNGVGRLLTALRESPNGLNAQIAEFWIERLIAARQYQQAYLQWVATLAPSAREAIGNVYNGDFEQSFAHGGFGWRADTVAGAHIDVVPAPDRQGSSLRLAFDDQRVLFQHLNQLLLLPAGPYRLRGQVRLEGLRSSRGLVWLLQCVEGGEPLARSEPLRGSSAWHEFSMAFEIPTEQCTAQWLRLQHAARIPSEQRIAGSVWFDDLEITRVQ